MAQSPTKNPESPLAWRFVTGKVVSESENVVHLSADVPHLKQTITARLAINPQHSADYPVGALIKLFIVQPAHGHEQDNQPLWHVADGAMAEFTQNPWLLGQVRNGDIVEGVVSRYVGDYAVIIALTHNLTQELTWQDLKEFTAFLHIQNTPDAGLTRNILQVLHIGDCVQATITKVDYDEISIHLNVKEWLIKRQQQLEKLSEQNTQQPILLQPPATPPIIRAEKNLLLIDDDKLFCSDMQKLLSHWQIKVRFCHRLQDLQKELSQQTFDACLMDCNLGLTDREQETMLALAKSVLPVARMTGDKITKQQADQPLLLKPLNIAHLLTWLGEGKIPDINLSERRLLFKNKEHYWQAQGAEAFVVERAKRLLQRCCQKIIAEKALWVKEERSGYYAIRTAYQINDTTCRKLEKNLQMTHIATAIETGGVLELIDNRTGSLHDTLGNFGHVFILPIQSDGKCERAVAFFSEKPFTERAKNYLHAQQDHLEDITYLMDTTLALEANETFATQGMLLSSTVHEFRTAASIVSGISQRLQELLTRPVVLISDNRLREDINSMVNASKHLVELSEAGLDRIRPEQQSIQDLQQLLSNTLELVRGRMYSLDIKATLAPLNCTIDTAIALPYPPKYVELPLINLLDNALLHCKARSWARVEVTLSLDLSHPELPILIQVTDSGLGMTAEQRKYLFTARKTGRGIAGSGMGLFLSKQLLESIGGQIELAKTVRWLGSCFNIRLPSAG